MVHHVNFAARSIRLTLDAQGIDGEISFPTRSTAILICQKNKTMIEKWTILSSEYLLNDAPWGVVRRDHMRLPSGTEVPAYYVLEYPNWVNVLGITKDKKMVLIEQYRHGIGEVSFELPAGICDEGEDHMEAAKRELLEETGYGGGNWQEWMVVCANPATHTNLTYCYLATDIEKLQEQDLESSEEIDVHLVSFEEAKKILMENKVLQSLQAAPMWKYFAECS